MLDHELLSFIIHLMNFDLIITTHAYCIIVTAVCTISALLAHLQLALCTLTSLLANNLQEQNTVGISQNGRSKYKVQDWPSAKIVQTAVPLF